MNEQYSGLCISGPKAGDYVTALVPEFKAPHESKASMALRFGKEETLTAPLEYVTTTYKHFRFPGAGELAFWVPTLVPGEWASFVLAKLVVAYVQQMREDG